MSRAGRTSKGRQWNVLVPVVAVVPADSEKEAIRVLTDQLSAAGFDAYEGEPGASAFESEDTGDNPPQPPPNWWTQRIWW